MGNQSGMMLELKQIIQKIVLLFTEIQDEGENKNRLSDIRQKLKCIEHQRQAMMATVSEPKKKKRHKIYGIKKPLPV